MFKTGALLAVRVRQVRRRERILTGVTVANDHRLRLRSVTGILTMKLAQIVFWVVTTSRRAVHSGITITAGSKVSLVANFHSKIKLLHLPVIQGSGWITHVIARSRILLRLLLSIGIGSARTHAPVIRLEGRWVAVILRMENGIGRHPVLIMLR